MKATVRALDESRWTVVALAIAGFAITFLQSLAFVRLAGHTFAEHAAFGYSLIADATLNAALFAPPVHPETVAGYLELRAFAPLSILFAAWALVAGMRSSTTPVIPRATAFAIGAMLAAAAACLGALVGAGPVSGLGLVETWALLVALATACFAISACLGPFAPPVILALFFINSLSRVFTQLEALRRLSPFRYYDLSTPLPRDGHFDVGGFVVLLAITAIGVGVAHVLPAPRARSGPTSARLLAVPVLRELYPQRLALAEWCVAFAVLGIALTAATRTTMQDLLALPRGLPGLPQYIFFFFASAIDATWFGVTLLMFVALTFAFVMRWADDDRSGRLEATLSAPCSRSALVIERLAALALTSAVLAALSGIAVALTASTSNIALDQRHLAEACLLLALFGVVLGAAALSFVSWWPRGATILFGAVVLAAYLADQIGSPLGLPAWAQNVSPFRLAGAPVATGLDNHSLALLIAIGVAGIGSSILLFQRRDVGV